jgi:hypothetical protein
MTLAIHRFAVGQSVRLKSTFGLPTGTPSTYRVTAILPERNNSPQYRIRSDEERYERVTTEDNLESAAP